MDDPRKAGRPRKRRRPPASGDAAPAPAPKAGTSKRKRGERPLADLGVISAANRPPPVGSSTAVDRLHGLLRDKGKKAGAALERPDPIIRVVIPSKLGLGPPRKAEKMLVPTADAETGPKPGGPARGRKRKLGRAP